ncbi:putative asparagine synthase [Mycena rebaudengoi]|nr:putative asparagine synthase [Mycena rebaudengoi]
MCGLIAALFTTDETSRRPSAKDLKSSLEASLDIIKHRGPDSRGTYLSADGRVGLGHVRLSIIDLETGQQPLSDEEGLIHCVVTGEIYDHDRIRAELENEGHSFKTKSDSELIVQLYKRNGFNLLFHLRGEFAFVLYDVKRRLLYIARDRFGIKPLYYTVSEDRILFASEMKAFMGMGWKAEWDITSIVQGGEFADDRTVFRGVKKLLAGHFAVCHASGYMKTQSYWDMSYPAATTSSSSTIDEMISTIQGHLVEAVRLRLRSDVPLAVYLSGGLDSSAVAGIATHLLRENDPHAKLNTFTLAYLEDPKNDEEPIAGRTAAHLGANIYTVDATEATLVAELEESIWHSEQPNATFHGAGKILLAREVHRRGFKVVLSGEGSDEVFGGYAWLPSEYLRSADPAAEGLGIPLPSEKERHDLLEIPMNRLGIMMPRPKSTDDLTSPLLAGNALGFLAGILTLSSEIFQPKVFELSGVQDVEKCFGEAMDPQVRLKSVSGHWHPLHVAQYLTAKTLMGHVILNLAGDRADMSSSVESRVAFLDHHLIEYVNTLPPSVKIRPVAGEHGGWILTEKWILREAVKPFITEEIYLRKKAMFNPTASQSPSIVKELLPLQAHLKARITEVTINRVGFLNWPHIRDTLTAYIEAPVFPGHGSMDPRAAALMSVLSFIVLQERFNVATLRL